MYSHINTHARTYLITGPKVNNAISLSTVGRLYNILFFNPIRTDRRKKKINVGTQYTYRYKYISHITYNITI